MLGRRKRKEAKTVDRIRREIRDQVVSYSDKELVEAAWVELDSWEAEPQIRQDVENDLRAAEQQLREHVLLADEGRRQLRRFLRNRLWQDRRPDRKSR